MSFQILQPNTDDTDLGLTDIIKDLYLETL